MFGIPIYFQVTQDASVASAGSRLIPAIIGNAVGGLLAGFTIKR
jgi:formate/nitrite transporter FocA (FNT family)